MLDFINGQHAGHKLDLMPEHLANRCAGHVDRINENTLAKWQIKRGGATVRESDGLRETRYRRRIDKDNCNVGQLQLGMIYDHGGPSVIIGKSCLPWTIFASLMLDEIEHCEISN